MTPENKKHLVDDTACIAKWRELIGRFNTLTKESPDPSKVKDELLKLKEESTNTGLLTYRQTDAICCRVNNYLAGKYGNTKSVLHMSQTKTGFSKAS